MIMDEEKKDSDQPKDADPAIAKKSSPKKAGIDRSKPYATVHGGGTGAAFSQDGKFYNNDGQEVDAP
jgi:hypothetical protein